MLGNVILNNVALSQTQDYRKQLEQGAFYHLERVFFVKTGQAEYSIVSLNLIQRIMAFLLNNLRCLNYYNSLLGESQGKKLELISAVELQAEEKQEEADWIAISNRCAQQNVSADDIRQAVAKIESEVAKYQRQPFKIHGHQMDDVQLNTAIVALNYMVLRGDIKNYTHVPLRAIRELVVYPDGMPQYEEYRGNLYSKESILQINQQRID